ncbi:MAG: DUF1974 domain-containing protein, partial [Gammaproteobacteria bacterium]|nr:DUF1974 domain-containing protein [Gammaproteobacteria bacterium]
LYLGSAAVKRYTDEGAPARDLPYVRWCCLHALHEVEMALLRVLDNYPNRPVAFLLRLVLFPWGQRLRPPSD